MPAKVSLLPPSGPPIASLLAELWLVSNSLICLILSSIGPAIFGREAKFVPALREAAGPRPWLLGRAATLAQVAALGPAQSTPLRRFRRGDGSDAGEKLRNRGARQAAGDEDQPRAPILVRPVLELDRRVGDVLDIMDDHRAAAFRDCEQALDAEEIGTSQCRQNRHGLFESRPAQRLVEDQREA